MATPSAVFSKELSRCHRQKDIRFLEALAVLEALRLFSPHWTGPRRVVIHIDNENVEYGLCKGSIQDPQTQVLFREIFSLCLQQHIDLVPVQVSSEANVLADALSRRRFAFIQQQFPAAFNLLRFNRQGASPEPLVSGRAPENPGIEDGHMARRGHMLYQPVPLAIPPLYAIGRTSPPLLRPSGLHLCLTLVSPREACNTSGLSLRAATLLWNGLAASTRAHAAAMYADFASFATNLAIHPFPASPTLLIEWVAHHHTVGKSYNTLKSDLSALKSSHIDLGLPTAAFADERLERTVRGFKQLVGAPLPVAKLPITLPLLRQLVQALHTVCVSRHNRRMYRATFCLAFACFLRSGELTWETEGPNVLKVAAVSFARDNSHVTVTLPASKMDPFWQGAALTAPAVNLSTCAVSALRVICHNREPQEPLFTLEGGQPFTRAAFVTVPRHCLQACSIPPELYSGHSFRRGAATWAASNGIDADTIRGLALYTNATAPLHLDTIAWPCDRHTLQYATRTPCGHGWELTGDSPRWQEIFVVLCTFAKQDEFSNLTKQLGQCLKFQYTVTCNSDATQAKEHRKNAVLCYLAAGKLEKVAGMWIDEMKEEELSLHTLQRK
ncbi:uncharacterized protein UTRI_05397 [Ustilago trichophora]|uniref:Uncharacterized protein n=1 Tax=Ustilago trichophora TaxID=86804 RepID=A0A5C3EL15_9BASI|nr:uncharacterized protein UTRI_05397 [Ustilago trichophora]